MGCKKLVNTTMSLVKCAEDSPEALATSMVCRICLATGVTLYDVNSNNMNHFYTELIGIYIIDERLPQKICWECAHRLLSCQKFKNKAMKSRDLLLSVLGSSQFLTLKDVSTINRSHHRLKSNLSITDTHYLHITTSQSETPQTDICLTSNVINVKAEETCQSDVKCEEIDLKDEVSNELYIHDYAEDSVQVNDDFNDSEDDKLLIEIKADKPKKVRRKKVKEKTVKKEKDKNVSEDQNDGDATQIPQVKRRRKNDIDANLFSVLPLSYDEQMKEIENRQHSSSYKNAPFKCTACFRGFAFRERYEAHAVRHTEQSGAYQCFICKSRLKTARALRKHVTGQHTEKYICKGCPFVTRSRGVAREHEKWHSGTRYQCPHCPSHFDKLTTYLGHVRIKHASQFVCALCGFTFVSKKGVQVHLKKKHRLDSEIPLEGPYCSVCDVKFVSEEAYDRHMKLSSKHSSEHDPARIRNDSQSVRLTTRPRETNSNDNEQTDTSEQPMPTNLTCEQCGVELRDLRIYAQHFRRAHPDKNRTRYPAMKTPAMCELCGRIFQSMALLKDHMWVHTGVKRFQCSLCEKSFTQKTNLLLHMRAHSDSRPSYPCHVCGKRFLFHNNRRRHMFIHTGLKPHSCTTCSKCFTTSGELKAHIAHVHLKKPWPRRAKNHKSSEAME